MAGDETGNHNKPVVPESISPTVIAMKKERLCLMQRIEDARVMIQALDELIERAGG